MTYNDNLIIWKFHKKNGITMVYGFRGENKFYDAVLTLHTKDESTLIYGFLSKNTLDLLDWHSLWQCLKKAIVTHYLLIEVLPEHAVIYKHYLHVIQIRKSSTFNGYDCEFLKIDMQSKSKLDGFFNQDQL